MSHMEKDELNSMLAALERPAKSSGQSSAQKQPSSTKPSASLPPATKAKTGSKRPPRKADLKFLVGGVLFFLIAVVYTVSGLVRSQEPVAATGASDSAIVKPGVSPLGKATGGAGEAATTTSVSSAGIATTNNALRPATAWAELGFDGVPQIIPLSKFSFPKDAKLLQVFCVLYSPLDLDTDRRWQAAGLFATKRDLTPHIRMVTLKDVQGYELLFDWRVEGIVTELPKLKNSEPPGVDDELTSQAE